MPSDLHNLLHLFMVASDISTFAFFILVMNVLVKINLVSSKCKGGGNPIKITLHKIEYWNSSHEIKFKRINYHELVVRS